MTRRILILGIGNYLNGDEGVGVHLVRQMQADQSIPAGTDVLEGGTGGFHLLEYFEQYNTVIMIDAALDNKAVGSISVVRPQCAADFPRAMGAYNIGMRDLVNALQLEGKMPDVWLVTMSIGLVQRKGTTLTPAIAACLPGLEAVVRETVYSVRIPQLSFSQHSSEVAWRL
ncbi:MAG: hydrogenase maturation protease [Chitinophagaceae bacterium]|jgi:hydrogenase maturation protease|nr:hydrogenase maturation protease [Chitinophagaceae bacterium]